MIRNCSSCNQILIPLFDTICFDCQKFIKDLIKPIRKNIYETYGDIIVNMNLHVYDATFTIRAKYSPNNAIYVRNKICDMIGVKFNTLTKIGKYTIIVTNYTYNRDECEDEIWWDNRHPDGIEIYNVCLLFILKKYTDTEPPKLSLISASKCAELGLMDGLDNDTIDRILEFDDLLAVRFLF